MATATATVTDRLREKLADRKATKDAARELERVSDPKRHAARLRAEAHRQKNCPIRAATSEINSVAQQTLPAIHTELASFAEYLKRVRAPITAKAEALKGLRTFGGDINRHAVFHLIDKHRRGSSFTPLIQRFLSDYNAARELDGTLTREHFFSTYMDQVMDFLSTYKLVERPKINAARIEYLTLRVLVGVVTPNREKYGARFEAASELEARSEARFIDMSRKATRDNRGRILDAY